MGSLEVVFGAVVAGVLEAPGAIAPREGHPVLRHRTGAVPAGRHLSLALNDSSGYCSAIPLD
jgi:hypothetical protein